MALFYRNRPRNRRSTLQHIREGISLSAEGWRNPPDGNGHAWAPRLSITWGSLDKIDIFQSVKENPRKQEASR